MDVMVVVVVNKINPKNQWNNNNNIIIIIYYDNDAPTI